MKKALLSLLVVFMMIAVQAQDKHKITIKINNLDPKVDTSCVLASYYGEKPYIKDSLDIAEDGTIIVEGDSLLDGGLYMIVINPENYFEFVVSDQEFKLETSKPNYNSVMKVTGSAENDVYYEYIKTTSSKRKEVKALQNQIKTFKAGIESRGQYILGFNGDTIKYNEIQEIDPKFIKYTIVSGKWLKIKKAEVKEYIGESGNLYTADFKAGDKPANFTYTKLTAEETQAKIKAIDKEVETYMKNLVKKHKDKLFPTMLLAVKDPEMPKELADSNAFAYYKRHYFDNLNFADGRLVNTPVFQQRIDGYFKRCVIPIPDSIMVECDYVLKKAAASEALFKFTLAHLLNKYANNQIMCMDAVYVYLVDNYYSKGQATWMDHNQLFKIINQANTLRPTLCGKIAPDLDMLDPIGNPQRLHDIKSDYTWILFWDPDCGHCKKSMPKFVKYYNEVTKEGHDVKVFSICTEIELDKWRKFVNEKGISDWINVADSTLMRVNFRELYDIKSTPKLFILDKNKKIIGKGIGAEQLPEFMDRQLGRKSTSIEEKHENDHKGHTD